MRDEIIDEILATAFEGGINYWSPENVIVDNFHGTNYASDAVSKGAVIQISEYMGDEPIKWHKLNRKKIIHGINRAAKHEGFTIERFWEEHDASSADIAVQFALFDEIRYG